MSQKLEVKHNRATLIGRVMCPKSGIMVCDTQCAHCIHCRIIEYDYVKCSYALDIQKEGKTYYSSL